MNRAQLKHVLLDVNLPHHNKIKLLKHAHGVQGKCALYEIYAAMAKATDAIIDKELALIIAQENDVADDIGFIQFCITRGLIQMEGSGYSNQPVIDDQEALFKQQERWRKAKGGKEQPLGDDSSQLPRGSLAEASRKTRGSLAEEARLSEDLNTEDLNINNKEMDTPQIRKALKLARANLRRCGRDIGEIQLEALLCRYHGRPKEFLAALNFTASLSQARNVIDPPEVSKAVEKRASEPVVRRAIDNYSPPSAEEKRPLSAEQRAEKERLMKELDSKISAVKSVPKINGQRRVS